ncbi:hypothetical protein FNV43_RR02521 [Rhamnella rubrinervis]|uniref:Uncharacterized protein n=1 Tax=Rhamnella rubrinervis TaxID=2594499 RepID=A0A8K0HRM5_9ROSA|nr:hypothetical protein FNV43_RR02521 [Rhamnella rubrinervis]
MEIVNSHPNSIQATPSRRKRNKYQPAVVRRSGRLQNALVPARKEDLVVEEIILSEGDKEDEQGDNMKEELPETTLIQKKREEKSTESPSKRRRKRYLTVHPKRSKRTENTNLPASSQDIGPVIGEMIPSESDKEDEQNATEEEELPEPKSGKTNMEEKLDYIVQMLETQNNTEGTSNFKDSFPSGDPNTTYKSLCVESQKRIEALTKENQQLSVKLEVALGKLEVYEKGPLVFSELMEKLKDIIVVSSLIKATETAVNISSEALRNALSSLNAVQEPEPEAETAAKKKRRR